MYTELEAGYGISHSSLERTVVEYFSDTVTCADKERFWKAIDFKNNFAAKQGIEPQDIGMIKSILFSYISAGQEKYFLVSTSAEKKVDYAELRLELGLSGEEAGSLTHKISDAALETITGKKRGAVSPLLDPEYRSKVDAVYFTRDLMEDAVSSPQKIYDLPQSLSISEFWNAATLFTSLQQKNPKYKTAGSFEHECEVVEWKIKEVDEEKAGYKFLFTGTILGYRGKEYQITNPPLKKEGEDRRRKKLLCTAFPISRKEDGEVAYEKAEAEGLTKYMKGQIFLPVTYESLVKLVQP